MNIVDSSAWLEYFADSVNANNFKKAIEDVNNLLVPSISMYEVYKCVYKQRGMDTATTAIGVMNQAQVVDLSTTISLTAATYSLNYKLPMADSIIYATAQLHDATVWTQDADFKNLPNVKYFKKK